MKRPFGRGTSLLRGRKLTMVINHLLTGMILQVEHLFRLRFDDHGPRPECRHLMFSSITAIQHGP